MNRDEARELLLRELSSYRKRAYSELQQELDIENVKRVAGDSGVEYFVEVSVERVNEIDPAIEVNGYASEVRGRRFLPKTVSASFAVTEDGHRYGFVGWPDDSA